MGKIVELSFARDKVCTRVLNHFDLTRSVIVKLISILREIKLFDFGLTVTLEIL